MCLVNPNSSIKLQLKSHLCGAFPDPSLPPATCALWHVPVTLSPNGSWVQVCLSHWLMSSLRLGRLYHVAKLRHMIHIIDT